jgi:hypothetical protein
MKAVLTTPEEAGPRRDVPVSGSKRARMVIKRVDPLSVLKVSLIFYLCMAIVFDAVAIITYWSLSALGALGSVTDLLSSLGFGDPRTGFQIDGMWLLTWLVVISGLGILVWSVVTTLFSLLYNLVSDLVGGVSVTLSEKR